MLRAEFDALTPVELRDLRFEWSAREARADYRAGLLCSVFANLRRGKNAPGPFGPEDFFPYVAVPKPIQTEEDMIRVILSIPGCVDRTKG